MNKRYPEEERQRHLSAYEKSGLSIKEYSKRNGLSSGIISFWRRRQQRVSVSGFEELSLPEILTGSLTIEYPTGVKIRLDSGTDVSVIKALLHC